MSKTKTKEAQVENTWEIKDRNYYLTGDREPLTFTLKSRHTENILYYGLMKTNNEQRALRYATNQNHHL